MCGVATAAGAFTLSAAVYVLHLDHYKSFVRSAIVTGFIGYLMVICGLMFDLGRPYRIWHPLIMWNPHSVMFEISWCVTLYTTVLALEFSVFLSEGLHWDKYSKIAHTITVPLVILGVILSTLHQSSLGSLFLIVPYKLYPLWYSPWLPVFFFSSALALGCAMVIVESFASSKVFKKELELDLLSDLGRVLVVTLAVYGIARFLDLTDRHVWYLVLRPGFERCMFLAEILLAPVGPLVLLLIPRARKNRFGLFMGASMVVVGFILNRFNVSMTGLVRASGTKYLPSWMEISVTVALVTFGLVLFGLAAKYLNIFPLAKPCLDVGQTCKDKPSCCLPTFPRVLIVTFWVAAASLIFNGIQDFRRFQPVKSSSRADIVAKSGGQPSDYPNLPGDFSFPQSQESSGKVTFSHGSHILVTDKCTDCHGAYFRIMPEHRFDAGTPRNMHSTEACGRCHDGKTAGNDCSLCHK
jgi:c(7)-type cytochrome triheme protein